MRVLSICGSLRRASSNRALLEAAALLAPAGVTITAYAGLAAIPPFNPDDDVDDAPPPAPVADLRAALAGCDGLLLSSPEYAHGVSGVLKNALDWVVRSGELSSKPTVLLNASARSQIAHPALLEILRTMDAKVLEEASTTAPLDGRRLDAAGIAGDPELAAILQGSLTAMLEAHRAAVS